jgi:hypothetical protein
MDWQNQYCENGYPSESNLQIQCNPHQNPILNVTEIEKKVNLDAEKTPNGQNIPEKKKQHWRCHNN